jgi:hypothetical protein
MEKRTRLNALFGLSLAVLVSAAVASTTPAAAAQAVGASSPVAVGLLRSDGVLFPLAQFLNGTWTPLAVEDPATGGSRFTPAARTLAREGWSAFPLSGGAPFPLAIGGIASVDSHCVELEAFRTDAPTRSFPPRQWPRPKTAIALWGGGTVAQSEPLKAPYDPAARRAARAIVGLTQAAEAERVEGDKSSRIAKYTAVERGRVPVLIGTMARHTSSLRTPYYFESRKRYAGGLDLFVTGWVVMSDQRMEVTHMSAGVTDQDYKGLETASVLGVVELADRAVWVLEAHGYESETYVLMEFDAANAGARAIRIGGGGC